MRILMLSQFYPPIIGGGAIHVRSLSAELVSRGHDVVVVTLWHEGQAKFELDRGVRVYRIRPTMGRISWLFSDSSRHYAPPFPDPEVMLGLRRIIINEQPEIVHAHNWLKHSFLPLKAWSKARLVVTLHDQGLVCVKTTLLRHNTLCQGPGLKKCLDCAIQYYGIAKGIPTVLGHRMMANAERGVADMFLPVSQSVAAGNGLVGSGLPYQVVHNFIPDDIAMLPGDSEPYIAQLPDEDYLLFVGALNRQKGVDVLLHAYAGLTNAPPLVLIGYDSPEWSTLSANCPPNVFVFKNWPRHAVMKAWYRSVIALLPSVGPESCPTVVMEAMSAGRPVIASRIGGLPDLVADGETGYLVEPGNASALQQALKQLLRNPDLRIRMGRAALHKVVEFQASTVVPRIEHIYEELLQKGTPSQDNEIYDDNVIPVESGVLS
jgi:glycosyltransferase involved in cell wall biosynthesis